MNHFANRLTKRFRNRYKRSLSLRLNETVKRILWFLLFLYLVVFPFGQFSRLPLPFLPGEVNIYLTDFLVGIAGVAGVVWGKRQNTPLERPFSLFLIASLFSLILASTMLTPQETVISSLYLLRVLFYGLFFFVVWNLVQTDEAPLTLRSGYLLPSLRRERNPSEAENASRSSASLRLRFFAKGDKERNLILNSLVAVGCAVASFGLVQYFLYPDLRALLAFGWDEHVNRVVGTFLDPNFTSIILVFTLLLGFQSHLAGAHWMQRVSPPRWAMLAAIFLAFLLTYSRGGYLAFVAGIGAVAFLQRKPRFFILGIALLLVGILLLPKQTSEGTKLERTTSIQLRMENLKEGLALFSDHPVFGVGFNTLRYVREQQQEKYGPSHAASGIDNSFLFILATTGVVGGLAFVNLTAQVIRESRGGKGSKEIIIPTLAALVTHSLFVNSLFYPWVLGWLALLFAATLRTSKH